MNRLSLTELTDENIERIPRHGFGVYKKGNINCTYRLKDLSLIGWSWCNENVFYCDKDQIDVVESKLLPLLRNVDKVKSVGFTFSYTALGLENRKREILIEWNTIESVLRKNMRVGALSIIVLTSESWRFRPIRTACQRNDCQLNLDVSIREYVSDLPAMVECYTLREIINDWGKLCRGEPVRIQFKAYTFSKCDREKIVRMEWKEK